MKRFGALVDETGRFVWCCMDTFGGFGLSAKGGIPWTEEPSQFPFRCIILRLHVSN